MFTGYRGIHRVITDQKNAEKELKENQERLHLSINMSGIGIWEWDMVSDYVTWDKRQFELFERSETDGPITLASITDVIHPDDRAQLEKTAKQVFESGASAAEEFRIILPNGSVKWLLGSSGVINFFENKKSALLIGVNMDITQSKQTEISLRQSQHNLQLANATLETRIAERTAELEAEAVRHASTQAELALSHRLESIGQLAGGVAHDFNNLLAIISGNLELAMPHIEHIESRSFLSKSLTAVYSGISLNRRLLAFARKYNLNPINLFVGTQLLEIVSLLERTLGENISITTKIGPTAWEAFIDPGEIDSALINLSINARDAMPGGGKLTIETRNVTVGIADIKMPHNAIPGDYIGLFVTDTGTGMTENVLKKAIDPFFTTKETGSGLGLSSIYGFAQQSGGFLTIDSQLEIGTTIGVFLPRANDQVGPPELTTAITNILKPKTESILILVVEDDLMVRELTVLRLKNIGYQVLEAGTGNEAVDLLLNNPEIKLVFSDIIMPGGMTGYSLALWLVAHRPDVKVLLTSGYYDPELAGNNLKEDNRFTILEKPYEVDNLAQGIKHALDS